MPSKPKFVSEVKKKKEEEVVMQQIAERRNKLKLISLKKLTEVIEKHILIADPHILKMMVATIIANKLPGDPVWIFLVGPSGGGKTMFLDLLKEMPEIYPLSNLTPSTFISGQQQTKGLLFEIDKKILTFKDFTTILQLYQEARNEIMSQLREIYDGSYKKAFGTGQAKEWNGKIGFIAGVTSVIDVTAQLYSALGERFIQYRLQTPDREEVAMVALDNSGRSRELQREAREEMQLAFEGCVRAVEEKIEKDNEIGIKIEMDYTQKTKLIKMANFATLARSAVMRDAGPSKEIYYKPTAEMPTRFTQQLNHIALALIHINRAQGLTATLTPDDELILYKIALDSIPMMRRIMLQKLVEFDLSQTSLIATLTNYPSNTARRFLEDLNVLGIIERKKDKNKDYWMIKDQFKDLLITYDNVKPLPPEERMMIEADIATRMMEDFGEKDLFEGAEVTP